MFGGVHFDQNASNFDEYSWKTIDRKESKTKFSLPKGFSFYFLLNCKVSEMCIRPIL